MTTRIDRIKAALEKHGWKQFSVIPEVWHPEVNGRVISTVGFHPGEHGMEKLLELFLSDKSMTGARIKDLNAERLVFGQDFHQGYFETEYYPHLGEKVSVIACDPDEAIAKLWEKVMIGEEE